MRHKIFSSIITILLSATLVYAASWKTTDTEDSSVNGGEIILVENEGGTDNNWLSLTTAKNWIFSLIDTQAEFEAVLFPISSINLQSDHNNLLFSDGVTFASLFQTKLTIINGDIALSTTALAANTCRTETDTATGAASTDVISGNFNASANGIAGYGALATDGMKIMAYPTADTVNFEVCNGTAAEITPGARTINWQIIK